MSLNSNAVDERLRGARAGLWRLAGPWWLMLLTGIAWLIISVIVLRFRLTSITTVGVLIGVVFLAAMVNVTAALFGGAPVPEGLTEEERAAFAAFGAQFRKGYIAEQGQSPQTIGYSLTDSPAGLAAWMLDHDTDSYDKISRTFAGGQPSGGLTRDHILDNITLYWLTGTATSAARMYWESARGAAAAAGHPTPGVSLPVAFTVFPGKIFQAPRSWAEQVYPNLIYFHEADKGGHFAAWEEPDLFVTELREAFRSLRQPPSPARTS